MSCSSAFFSVADRGEELDVVLEEDISDSFDQVPSRPASACVSMSAILLFSLSHSLAGLHGAGVLHALHLPERFFAGFLCASTDNMGTFLAILIRIDCPYPFASLGIPIGQ